MASHFSHLLSIKKTKRFTGFALPLVVAVSAVLMLGSASIHTLSLHARLRFQVAFQRQQALDQLRSAAQAFTTMARGAQACLLLRPSVDWNFHKSSCSGANPNALLAGNVDDQPWRLLSWHPGPGSGNLQLALADGRRGTFRLKLAPDGRQILGVSDVQLQGRIGSQALS